MHNYSKIPTPVGRKKWVRQSLVRGLMVGALMGSICVGQALPALARSAEVENTAIAPTGPPATPPTTPATPPTTPAPGPTTPTTPTPPEGPSKKDQIINDLIDIYRPEKPGPTTTPTPGPTTTPTPGPTTPAPGPTITGPNTGPTIIINIEINAPVIGPITINLPPLILPAPTSPAPTSPTPTSPTPT